MKKNAAQNAVDAINAFCIAKDLDYHAELPNPSIKTKHNEVLITHMASDSHSFMMSAHDFIKRSRRCPKCYGTPKKTIEEFKRNVKDLVGDEYSVLSNEYFGNKVKLRFRHNICGREYEATPNKFLLGRRCPYCSVNNSKAEEIIYKELLKNGLAECDITRQKKYSDLKDKSYLRYDFYIGKFNLLLEFDGEQHYKPFRRADGKKRLDDTKKHDKMKDEYAVAHNIRLVRIPYTEFPNLAEKIHELCQEFQSH